MCIGKANAWLAIPTRQSGSVSGTVRSAANNAVSSPRFLQPTANQSMLRPPYLLPSISSNVAEIAGMRAASSFDSLPLPLVPARENATSMAVSALADGATDGTASGLGVVAGTGVWATAANATGQANQERMAHKVVGMRHHNSLKGSRRSAVQRQPPPLPGTFA